MRWRAWYADGRVISSAETDASELPRDLCVGFVCYHDRLAASGVPYRDLVTGGDWYVVLPCGRVLKVNGRPDGTWVDPPGSAPDEVVVRSAPSLPDDEWARVQAEMWEARSWR